MNATEARRLQDAFFMSQQLDMDSILSEIKKKAAQGYDSISIDVASIDSRAVARIVKQTTIKLQNLGFTCKYHAHSGRNETTRYIEVTW